MSLGTAHQLQSIYRGTGQEESRGHGAVGRGRGKGAGSCLLPSAYFDL
jgi:hypothetical protein